MAAACEYVFVANSAVDRTTHFQSSVGSDCTPVPRTERGTECVREGIQSWGFSALYLSTALGGGGPYELT